MQQKEGKFLICRERRESINLRDDLRRGRICGCVVEKKNYKNYIGVQLFAY